jgi:hypothetical protein
MRWSISAQSWLSVPPAGLAREQRLDLVLLSARRERRQRGDRLVHHRLVAFHFGELDQFGGIVPFTLDRPRRGDRFVEAAAFAHDILRGLGIVPQRRVLDLRVELVEAAHRTVPVEEPAKQRQRRVDRIDMVLRFGAHVIRS